MRGDHPGSHPHPQGYLEPIGSRESIPSQSQINSTTQRATVRPWGLYLGLLVVGAVSGTLGLFWHGNFHRLAGFPLPWGLVLAGVLNFLVLRYAGQAAATKNPRFGVTGITFAWVGIMAINFVAFFLPATNQFFLPAPLGINPFISIPILLDRLWQLLIFVLLPLATWLHLRELRAKKD